MNFLRLVKNFFTKTPQETKGGSSFTNSSLPPLVETRKILKDRNGNNLVCCLCNNLDNETNKSNPIYEGQNKTWDGKVWHIACFRYFKKHARDFLND